LKKLSEADRRIKKHDKRTNQILKLASCVRENPDNQELASKAKSLVEDWTKLTNRMYIKVDTF